MTRLRVNAVPGVTIRQYQAGNLTAQRSVGGSSEQIEDVNHGSEFKRYLGSGTDVGGPMLLNRNGTTYYPADVISTTYRGTQVYLQGIGIPARPLLLTDAQIKGQGATAISRSSPTNPTFDASTFIGEAVSGGLPALSSVGNWKDVVSDFRGRHRRTPDWHKPGSSEFLNYQFGWLPFLADMQNFARAAKNSTEILEEFRAGSGKNTRVGYQFPENVTTTLGSGNRLLVRPDNVAWEPRASSWEQSVGAKSWFSGCFTYHIPMGNDTASKMRRFNAYANKLYGIRITPEVLWNLTPWSWALDWFGNTGDVLANISMLGNDGLVMKYGYMMYHNWGRAVTRCAKAGNTTAASVIQVSEVKKRFPASPYLGFAESGSLTTRQTAIVAALGLNRVPR